MREKRGSWRTWDVCFAVLFLAIFCLYLYKLPLGIPSGDEAFYLTVPKRLLQGDALLADEWHGSQLTAFLTAPLMALRDLLFPGSQGIVLQWRYFYLAVHALVSVTVYLRLRGEGYFGALAAALLFLFTPYDIPSLGYNTLAVDMVSLSGTLLYTARSRWAWLAAGLAFAAGVLCTPHLVLVFACYALGTLVWCLVKRDRELLKNGLCFWGGCALLAAALFLFLFSRATWEEMWAALPYIFADPAHDPFPSGQKLRLYGAALLLACGKWIWAMAGLCVAAALDRGRRKRSFFYFLLGALLTAVMELRSIPGLLTESYHYPLVPPVLLGTLCFILTEKRNVRLFLTLFLMGVGETVAVHLASNQWVLSITAFCIIPDLAALLFLRDFLAGLPAGEERRDVWRRTVSGTLCAGVLLIQGGLMVYTKTQHKFWSTLPNSALTVTLDRGPYAGFKVGEAAAEKYNTQLDALTAALGHRAAGRASFPGEAIWHNLIFPELGVGSFSAWLEDGRSATVDRWRAYCDLDPSHVPDYICFYGPGKWNMDEVEEKLLDPYGFVPEDWGELTVYVRK